MKIFLVAIVLIFLAGCAVNGDHAASIARRELARRKLPLPENYKVEVTKGFAVYEFGPSYTPWIVLFRAPVGKKPLYRFSVDQRNGLIEDFTDCRGGNR